MSSSLLVKNKHFCSLPCSAVCFYSQAAAVLPDSSVRVALVPGPDLGGEGVKVGTQGCFSWIFPSSVLKRPQGGSPPAAQGCPFSSTFISAGKYPSLTLLSNLWGKTSISWLLSLAPPDYRCNQPLLISMSASLCPCLQPAEFICLRLRNLRVICPRGSPRQMGAVAPHVLPARRHTAALLGQSPPWFLTRGLALPKRVLLRVSAGGRGLTGSPLHAGTAWGQAALTFLRLTFLIEG